MTSHHPIAKGAFKAKTLRALANKNIFLASASWIPGADGSFANGETVYLLSNGKMVSFLEVLKLAS